jgi:dipeptidyl aminopeptidase/acylaminoacyl peptidase
MCRTCCPKALGRPRQAARLLAAVMAALSLPTFVACNPASKPAAPKATASRAKTEAGGPAEEIPPPATSGDDASARPSADEFASGDDSANADGSSGRQQKPAKTPSASHLDQPGLSPSKEKTLKNRSQPPNAAPDDRTPDYLADAPLILRETLFGNPDRAAARISPDGKRLAYLAPVDGVLNVWVGPIGKPAAARPVTDDKKRGIRVYHWAFTNEHIIYLQDVGGDEDWHVYAVDLVTTRTTDLTPLEKVNAQIVGMSHRQPETVLIGLNDRDPTVHDVHRVRLDTGKREVIEKNTRNFTGYVVDDDLQVRFASRMSADGGSELLKREGDDQWESFLMVPMEDTLTTQPLGFDKSGQKLYFIDSRGRETGALTAWDLESGQQELLAENGRADIGEVLSHPVENTIDAVSFTWLRKEWRPLDDAVKDDLDYLASVADGEVSIASQSLDNQQWIVAYLLDDGPVKYYRYDRGRRKATFLFNNRDDLEGLPLVKMHPVTITTRDELTLVSYLTLPPGTDADGDGRPSRPLPLVLNVHGGPWARDIWGFNPTHQWLANRGYAVLSVNFRGSTGLGKEFTNAGNREWAGKMHDDLIDAVDWAVKEQIADRERVAIMGGSYGGYATLVGLTFTPDVFACGVDIVGPSNIMTLLGSIPPYWRPMIQMFKDRVGDYSTEKGKQFLEERSPLSHVDQIARPLLIGQGANDPRVKRSEADQIVSLLKRKEIPVTYVLYPDEGHGFARPENRLSFNAVAEAFLSEHLGGRFEPIGDAFGGASITVPTGADQVPGLAEALARQEELPAAP